MRGQTLFTQLTTDEQPLPEAPKAEAKGRSAHLISRRNSALIHRYYYKARLQRKQMQDVYNELEEEFFISRTMIIKVLQANADVALSIKKSQVTITDMRRLYPQFTWN